MNNEGILLLFIRQVEPKILGRTFGKPSTDFNPLSGLEGVRIVGFRCSSLVDSSFDTLFTGRSSSYRKDGTHFDDVPISGIG